MIRVAILCLALVGCAHPRTVEGRGFTAVDGDTLRGPAGERIRLAGIDSPELPGHCRPGRHCAPGDPWAARDALAALIAGQYVVCTVVDVDRYARLVARCRRRDDQQDLGTWQLEHGFAMPYRYRGS